MDSAGIDLQVLSASLLQPYGADPIASAAAARLGNDLYAKVCQSHPDRFLALGAVPLPHVTGDGRGRALPGHAGLPGHHDGLLGCRPAARRPGLRAVLGRAGPARRAAVPAPDGHRVWRRADSLWADLDDRRAVRGHRGRAAPRARRRDHALPAHPRARAAPGRHAAVHDGADRPRHGRRAGAHGPPAVHFRAACARICAAAGTTR